MTSAPNATVSQRTDLHAELSILRIRPDTPRRFSAGQHVEVGFFAADAVVRRFYSIASAPGDPEIEIFASASGEAFWPAPGSRVFVSDPFGTALSLSGVPEDTLVVMVATGTGVAPFVSMIRGGVAQRVVLLHAVRAPVDLGYREELAARRGARFVYEPIVSRDPSWPGRKGRVQEALQAFASIGHTPLDPERCCVLVCGNKEMIAGVEALLVPRGFRLGENLRFERY